jgi:type II secretory pathway pseudopilin PulG
MSGVLRTRRRATGSPVLRGQPVQDALRPMNARPRWPAPRANSGHATAFSLVEAALAMVLVAMMFAAGMSAAGAAARDRLVQAELRQTSALARSLLSEILQQQYADPSPNSISQSPGVSTTDRSNWKHIDDYTGFNESPPNDRWGIAIPGAAGWRWQASIVYVKVTSFAAAGNSVSSGGGIVSAVSGPVSIDFGASSQVSATDTGLKRIVVTVTSPLGKTTTVTGLRTTYGVPDRLSTGFHAWAGLGIAVGPDSRPIRTGAPLLNTPPSP